MLKKYTQVDWTKTVLMLLPPLLRQSKQVVWLNVLLTPLKNLYDDTLYKMQHNGQVMYLEKVLNDLFNPEVNYEYYPYPVKKKKLGYIFIEDAFRPEVQYLYTNKEIAEKNGEIIPVYLHDEDNENQLQTEYYLYLSGGQDFNSTEFFNFRIFIPSHLLLSTNKYKSILNCIQDPDSHLSEKDKVEQVQELSDMLVVADKDPENPYSDHPNAINIVSPKFHKVLNYYKLAGKSYETRYYDYIPEEEVSLETVRKNKEDKQYLTQYMYIK